MENACNIRVDMAGLRIWGSSLTNFMTVCYVFPHLSFQLALDMSQAEADLPSHPEAGLRTSDFYRTKDMPERFNHPG